MADQDPKRPTFTSFWKRSKEALTGRKITFVQGDAGQESSSPDKAGASSSAALSEKEKAKLRRAQVRRAQIQHRERKANYVRQLELDVARYRDLISTAEREVRQLQGENDGLRTRVASGSSTTAYSTQPASLAGGDTEMLTDADIAQIAADITMTFDMDDIMQTPSYQITSSPDPSITSVGSGTDGSPSPPGQPGMTPEQTFQAINFILALEHICWNHFEPADFQPGSAPDVTESGHSLMATSVALSSAPPEVFAAMTQTHNVLEKQKKEKGKTTAAAANNPGNGTAQSPATMPPGAATASWQTSDLTLWSLYGLANSLNPPDLDLAPVQAWFELASQYPVGLLLREDILTQMKREFIGVVTCPHYGAAIERDAFESIVGRILTPEVVAAYEATVAGAGAPAAVPASTGAAASTAVAVPGAEPLTYSS